MPVVIGAFGTVTKRLVQELEDSGNNSNRYYQSFVPSAGAVEYTESFSAEG